jgi:seryl-tRNA synthetase
MMDNITKAINHWELQVSKVTNETRQMMLGFLNLVASTVQDGQSTEMDQVLAKGNDFQDEYLWDK